MKKPCLCVRKRHRKILQYFLHVTPCGVVESFQSYGRTCRIQLRHCLVIFHKKYFFCCFCGSKAQLTSLLSFLHRTQLAISDGLSCPPQRLLCTQNTTNTTDKTNTTDTTNTTDISALNGTRTRYPSNEAASDFRLKDQKATGISQLPRRPRKNTFRYFASR